MKIFRESEVKKKRENKRKRKLGIKKKPSRNSDCMMFVDEIKQKSYYDLTKLLSDYSERKLLLIRVRKGGLRLTKYFHLKYNYSNTFIMPINRIGDADNNNKTIWKIGEGYNWMKKISNDNQLYAIWIGKNNKRKKVKAGISGSKW